MKFADEFLRHVRRRCNVSSAVWRTMSDMNEPRSVPELAKELGVKIPDVLRACASLNLPIRRGAARLTTQQVRRLRRAHEEGFLTRRKPAPIPPKSQPRADDWATSECKCCTFRFEHSPEQAPLHCQDCAAHYETDGEPHVRTIRRLSSHCEILERRATAAASKAAEYHDRMKAALRSRDTWKRVLVDVALGHERTDEGCCCGAPEYPCASRLQLQLSNPGIAHRIEELECLPPGELRRVLEGDDDAANLMWD